MLWQAHVFPHRCAALGAKPKPEVFSLMNLAMLVQKRGDTTWAKMLLKEAVEVRRAVFGEYHPDYAQCLVALGEIYGQQGEPAKAETMKLHPGRRIASPEEIALAAVFMISDECPFMNATCLTVDGGLSVQQHA